jgi:hydrogenase-4 component F
MLAALATLTPLGFVAVVFQIWNHGLVKSNFFLLTGTAGREYEDADLEKMKGIGREHKALGFLFASSSLAMVGSPPFGMFWSELLIVQSILSVGSILFLGLGITLVLNVFLSIVYYYRIINTVALSSPAEGKKEQTSLDKRLLLSPIVLLSLSILTGILPSIILGLIA